MNIGISFLNQADIRCSFDALSQRSELAQHVHHVRCDMRLFPKVVETKSANWMLSDGQKCSENTDDSFATAISNQIKFEEGEGCLERLYQLAECLGRLPNLTAFETSGDGKRPMGGLFVPRPPDENRVPDRYTSSPTTQIQELVRASTLAHEVNTRFSVQRLINDESCYQYAWRTYDESARIPYVDPEIHSLPGLPPSL